MAKEKFKIQPIKVETEADIDNIIKSLAPRKTKETRESIRARALERAALILRNLGVVFDKGNVLLIAPRLKAVIAFDIAETLTEAQKYAANEGYDLFHIRGAMITNPGLMQNAVTRIAEGRGREIFNITDAQKAKKAADNKVAEEITSKTGGKISSRNYPARF